MGSRSAERSLKRRAPFRQPKIRILVVCEGRLTERGYIRALQHHAHNPRVHVEVAKDTGVPLTVVQCAIQMRNDAENEARRQRDENLSWDEVWGVFDVDEHPNLQVAVDLANSSGIKVAVSNPCFELWALLHFAEQRAHLTRHKARSALHKFLPKYDKELDFAALHPNYATALERAKSLDALALHHGEPGRNPSTGVYMLAERILGS